MLRGTCLGEALQALQCDLGPEVGDLDDDDELTGPDGNGEDGCDLDLDLDGDNDNSGDDGSPGPVDGPSVFSEVVLAHKRGICFSL